MTPTKEELKNALVAKFGNKTDLSHRLSYSNGVKNIFGMRNSDASIRIRVDNKSNVDRIIYFMPSISGDVDRQTSADTYFDKFGLPTGNLFFVPEITTGGEDPDTLLTITSLNPKQDLHTVAWMLNTSPIFLTKAHLKSYNSTTNLPESSNFGNDIRHYVLNYFKGQLDEDTPLYLTDGERRSDNTTSVMTIDFISKQFNAFVSPKDVLAFKVNANTKMDIDLTIGVQDSVPEDFFRQVRNGVEIINQSSPELDCNCK